jgi:hypothetical protein
LLALVILLIVVGVALYLVSLIPMDATIKRIITVLVIVVVVLYVLVKFVGPLLHGLKL